nr:probable cytochrome P450 313a2 [Drosophila suzukii]
MISVHLLIAAGILLWIRFLWSRRKLYLLSLQLPGSWGLPIIGIAAEYFIFYRRKISIRRKYMNKYGSTFLTWMGTMPVVLTRDPKIAEDVLTSSSCTNRSPHATNAIADAVGPGLITLQGTQWAERRKQLNPAFKHNVLLSFLPIFNDETRSLVSLFESFVGQGEVDVLPDLIRWSFRTSTQTTLGTDVKEDENYKNDTILESFQSVLNITTLSVLMPFLQNTIFLKLFGLEKMVKRALSTIGSVMDKIINKKLKTKSVSTYNWDPEVNTVIHRAIELYEKDEISYSGLMSECSIIVVTAFETSAHTVYHSLILLAMFPDIQEKVFNEIKELLPTTEDLELTYEDLQQLVYLDRVLNESMRVIAPVPLITRDTIEDLQLSNGVLIPKGVTITVDIFSMHRNPDVWGPEANKFNPDNFLPDKISKMHPYAFMPFSKGRRNCIGWRYGLMSIKLALVKIL